MFPGLDSFKPTAESIPPPGNVLRLRLPQHIPVNYHPLVSTYTSSPQPASPSTLKNPLEFLLRAATIYPTKIAIAHPDAKAPAFYAYSIWAQRVQNLAYALIKAGLRPRDRVAVISGNTPMMADAFQGAIAARVVLTPINIRLTRQEVTYILEHSGAKLILVDSEYLHIIEGTPIKIPVVICNDTGRIGDPYEQFLSDGRRFSAGKGWSGLEMDADENFPSTLCYTSGTTGRIMYNFVNSANRLKGVLSTLRGSYLAAVANVVEGQMSADSTYLWILPMFHAGGWTFPWANTLAFATQITMRNVDYSLIWKHLLHSKVTHYCGAPTVQIGIVNAPGAKRPSSPIKAFIAGTLKMLFEVSTRANRDHRRCTHGSSDRFLRANRDYSDSCIWLNTYGPFTRGYPQEAWASLSLEGRSKLMARQGYSFATASDLRVVYRADESPTGPEGELVDVPSDGTTMGEIVTRGNIVMQEYFGDPEATKKAFRGGYFGSGDLAVMHSDGSIAILDRQKDIIISGGENASKLSSHPHVLEVSVVARPHKKWGERAMAFVTLHPQHVSKWEGKHDAFAKDLIAHARKRLPGFACPEWVQVVQELPKTSTGKILKIELRKTVAKL
ncbi:hypothetical protein D9757_002787 [Collybiopsis confluens]|uniref:Acetyl-CoA synthetase-like protein n=1 Tax=Collybiopsis confluens TaxID=2823264 RepID=A0A8H5ME45_9AGAR|nr:hypothetical protein D9757_002787 [Collybiopsis confluens]